MNYYSRYMRKLSRGLKTTPRGFETTSAYNVSFLFSPGTCWRRPKDNPAIGFIEGLQFIAGTEDKEAIKAAAPNVNLDLFGPTSFYGPRTAGQFQRVSMELQRDECTRRAVVTIINDRDTPETMPCTLSMNFTISPVSSALDCTVTMRSSDAVWGLPYDMIQFGMVHFAMASSIGKPIGTCTVNIANAHIYKDHDAAGLKWSLWKYKMPVFDRWSKYAQWAQSTASFHPTRAELEEIFALSEVQNDK